MFKKIRISESTQGHNGCANGGYFGSSTYLFGIFPDDAVKINATEDEGAIHLDQPNWHQDKWEKKYCVDREKLRPGDFVAIEHTNNGQVYNSSGGSIDILAHRLPIGADMPDKWRQVGGEIMDYMNNTTDITKWYFVRLSNGEKESFDSVCKELDLTDMPHPYGRIWLKDSIPVAINSMPKWSMGAEYCGHRHEEILGDISFFSKHDFAVIQISGRDICCSQEICLKNQPLENLQQEGWLPVEVADHFVVWATGLCLYPKHLKWQFGLDPTAGKKNDQDPRGTRIFDYRKNRLEKVRRFFLESLGLNTVNPKKTYIRLANQTDPRRGRWYNSYQYPESWEPDFMGWNISQIQPNECRWKQPTRNNPFFYGIVYK